MKTGLLARFARSAPRIAPGQRIYAIGDVHGCFELLGRLTEMVRADAAARPELSTTIVLLGDLVDRGPRSAEVVNLFMRLTPMSKRLVVLKGNHEQVMVDALGGDIDLFAKWLAFGGRETLASWGVSDTDLAGPIEDLYDAAAAAVPQSVLLWLDRLPLSYRSGDFFFCHAGIRPGVELGRQEEDDLLWIRDGFVDCEDRHPMVIVHGHTIVEERPQLFANRIAIDTGAYRSGKLSAVGFEEDRQWLLST